MRICKENELNLSASILTIVAFDGMHLEHQSLVIQMVNTAKKKGVPSVAIVCIFDQLSGANYRRKNRVEETV
ncbi:hypothetical protein [Pseudogracilibacillus sp. SO30301A]|uniref:hypothetical protein n=1 Tax=Pseudogracilibacillus sp. SO30301A TaxID=3098291 RepID=UPI00300E427F